MSIRAKSKLAHHPRRASLRGHGYFKRLGPGIVTSAADDDPSGIATYSQVGAAQGLSLLWMAPFLLPLAVGVQESTARLGLVTGKGLGTLIRERFPRSVLVGAVVLVASATRSTSPPTWPRWAPRYASSHQSPRGRVSCCSPPRSA